MPTATASNHSPMLAEVLAGERGILKGTSAAEVSRIVASKGFKLSDSTIRYLKRGYWGRIETIRILARVCIAELMRYWGREIREACGEITGENVVAWLVWVAETNGERSRPAVTVGLPRAFPFVPPDPSPAESTLYKQLMSRPVMAEVVQAVLDEQAKRDSASTYLFRKVSEYADYAVRNGQKPPDLRCPDKGWSQMTGAEAEQLVEEYRVLCGVPDPDDLGEIQ